MSAPPVKAQSVEDRLNQHIADIAITQLFMTGPPSNQSITSTTDTLITGLTATVTATTYRIHAQIGLTQGSAAFSQNIVLHGPATSAYSATNNFFLAASGDSNGLAFTNTFGTVASPAFAIGSNFWLLIEGVVTFSAGGNFSIQASEGTSTHAFTVQANSFCDLIRIA